jgi:hypothetical protein
MLLRDLLAAPGLGLRLLHGSERALEGSVRWVYTTDLPDPGRYISGGELVITGLVWRNDAADSERFVTAVANAGAAALAAGDALFHGVPDDLVEACRRHDVVLLGVPEDVSFGDLTEYVIGQVAAQRGARLEARLGRQQQLLSGLAAGRRLDELTAEVSREAGVECRVLTPTGRHVVAGAAPLPSADLDRVTRCFLSAAQLPAVATRAGATTYSVFAVGPALGERLTSWMVVAEGTWSSWDTEVADAVGELAAIAALERARQDEGLRVGRHIAEGALAMIAEGAGGQPDALARLRQSGLDPERALAVAVATFPGRPELAEAARSVLADAAAHLGPPVVAGRDDDAVAVLPAGDPGFADTIRLALLRLAPGVARGALVVGVSEASEPAALAGAWEEARYAQRLAELRGDAVGVVTGAEVTSYVLLLATVPDEVRRTFATRVLGPVTEYDERHGAGLQDTLATFLDCSGSWSRTAERMHLHVNTVRYRIARVEELTGRNLSDFENRVDVFLALRSLG